MANLRKKFSALSSEPRPSASLSPPAVVELDEWRWR